MKDIRLSFTFWDHWKTAVLISDLGLDAAVCLQRLWVFVAQNKLDGNLSRMPQRAIELAAQWNGVPGALIDKLVELRFLDTDNDGNISLHDWDDYR
jgi:hypothetical protein